MSLPQQSLQLVVLFCILVNHRSDKPRQDLNIYKKNELEFTFIEILNSKKSNVIVGTIYKHPLMYVTDFNSNYLNNLVEKVSKEQKSVFILGYFNINLLNYNVHNPTAEFLDSLASKSLLPFILQPARITSHSKTLIHNILTKVILPDLLWGNLAATGHLSQFLIVSNTFCNPPLSKSNIYERDWSNFDQENFILDYFSIDWNETLETEEQNIGYSTVIFFNKINVLLDDFLPFKKSTSTNLNLIRNLE